jgi:hypothetical protein
MLPGHPRSEKHGFGRSRPPVGTKNGHFFESEADDEARENLKEAMRLIIEANRELARHESEGTSVIRNLKAQ